MPDTTRRIKLTIQTPTVTAFKGKDAFRVVITASDANLMTEYVFLYRQTLVDPEANEYTDEFLGVCSAFDLTTYPANEPDAEQSPPFFRKATVDVIVPSVTVATDTIATVEAEVSQLVSVLDQLDVLSETTIVWYPSAP